MIDVVGACSREGSSPRQLTAVDAATVKIYCVPEMPKDSVFVGINDRDPAWHDLYKVSLSSGSRELLHANVECIGAWYFDRGGRLRLVQRKMATSAGQELISWGCPTSESVLSFHPTEFCRLSSFHQDGTRAYVESNIDSEFVQLISLDCRTGEYEIMDTDPLGQNDLASVVFSETGEPLLTIYEGERQRRYFRDEGYREDFEWLQTSFPDFDIEIVSRTHDERSWLIDIFSDTEPGQFYLFSRNERALTFQLTQQPATRREELRPMRPIGYESSDGMTIPGYVILPGRRSHDLPPLIVIPHGGPWMRDSWAYHATAQLFANRGYAILMPNFRGSSGYGTAFLNAGNGEWGRKMLDDIGCGVVRLVNDGAVDPRRVGILGSSYGGYAALAAAAFTPTLFRAAVAIASPSNLLSLLKAIPTDWEALRETLYCRVGDPTTEAGQQRLRNASPFYFVDNIQIPMMLVHGIRDGRVRCSEAEQMVAALWKRGVPAEYLRLPDEGHTFSHPLNRSAVFAKVEQFFAEHLGGAFEPTSEQEERRLDQIRVRVGGTSDGFA